MNPSRRCYEIIKDFESFSPKPYKCPAGLWTIGWGHTLGVTADTPPVTEQEAQYLLEHDVDDATLIVAKAVTVPLLQGQLDALVSFVFNVGPGREGVKDGFVMLKDGRPSTMLRKINEGDFRGAADEFLRWNKVGGQVLVGLVKRRIIEKSVFES